MRVQNITNFIELQGVNIENINCKENIIELWVIPKPDKYVQNCPNCGSSHVIRNGSDGYRSITHLPICKKPCEIIAPKIRLRCKVCDSTFAYQYEFVEGKERYTIDFKAKTYHTSVGSTVKKASELLNTPYSTTERFFKGIVMKLIPFVKGHIMELAKKSTKLVLGIDDFAIRKGHNYNTGIHDLKGETFMGIVKGRTLKNLEHFTQDNPSFVELQPYAVVMDLAKQYHTFIKQLFPQALRVADRFHVNHYIMNALNGVRRRISIDLNSNAKLELKRNKHLLNKRGENLNKDEKSKLCELLSYSNELKSVYEYKENLAQWYDCSTNYNYARLAFEKMLAKGHSLKISELDVALKTFENWKDEINNYHRCRFTNAIVEGRNNKIKTLQRRRFFLPNRDFYEALIFLECNTEIAFNLFNSLYA